MRDSSCSFTCYCIHVFSVKCGCGCSLTCFSFYSDSSTEHSLELNFRFGSALSKLTAFNSLLFECITAFDYMMFTLVYIMYIVNRDF